MRTRPNFIVIHTDQQRGDCLGVEGRKGLFTPNMDYLAVRGARFTSAYATTPVCIPQRLSFLSGQLASTHGVLGNVGIPYVPMEHSLPRELGRAGYQTALVGRTFHTTPVGDPIGFEYHVPGDPSSTSDPSGPGAGTDRFMAFLQDNAPRHSWDYYANGTDNNSVIAAPFSLENALHHTQWTTERALEYLRGRDTTRPFFLTVGYFAPHGPQNPPAEYFNRYYYGVNDLDDPVIAEWDIPPIANWSPDSGSYVNLHGELLRTCRAGYYGNITFADIQIGRILNAVARMPNTYVLFTSDHGEQLGDHYLYHKGRPYEGASRIPFVIHGPGIDPVQVRDEPVGWHDILPTVLDLAGLPCPDGVDGQSIVPLFNRDADPEWRPYLHSECSLAGHHAALHHTLPGQRVEGNTVYEEAWHALTDGKAKYIWYSGSGREQFFDLSRDRSETRDLVLTGGHEDTVALWRSRLARTLKDRPEGFSDGEQLKPGRDHKMLMPHAQGLMKRRIDEGYDIAFAHYHRPRPPA